MREHVMRDGGQVDAQGIYRGQMLVRPEGEWLATYQSYMRGRLVFDALALGTLGALFLAGALLWLPLLGLLVLATWGLVAATEAWSFRASRGDLRTRGVVPGLYEHGVELPMFPLYATRLFIPWSEMEEARARRSRLLDDTLLIDVRGSRWSWRFPGRLLGEEGIQEAMARAGSTVDVDRHALQREPPRLVLYSPAGTGPDAPPGGPEAPGR
mgnify:CR=1 FL=1